MADTPPKKIPRAFAEAYRRTDVITANRETILLMMYAGAIRFLKQAIEAAERGDMVEKVRLVGRTLEIVNELRATLNFEVGGDIANHLEGLYAFITKKLFKGNLDTDLTPLKEALGILSTLNGAWEEAIASLKKEKTTA